MPETMIEQARRALQEERVEDAQALLINVIVREPEQDEAWLLLAEALADTGKKRECLERARAINPRNVAIMRALERLNQVAVAPTPPTVRASVESNAPKAPSEQQRDLAAPLLQHGEQIAQTLLLTMEPPDTAQVGGELLKTLDKASAYDPTQTRRWARGIGRAALFKYEKALSASIAGLPRDDPQLPTLREQRQRTLEYLR